MQKAILILLIFNIMITILLGCFLSHHIGRHIHFVTLDWEWRKQLGQTMVATAKARRDNHLEIMKQFKGQSYEGKFGEFDVHTDPNIPANSGPVFVSDKIAESGGPW